VPNLIPKTIEEWMRRMEFKVNDLTRRMSSLIPGDIADGVDLNDFMTTGRWRRPSAVGTTTGLNYPRDGSSGTLEVYWEPTNPQVHQIFYDRSGSRHSRWWNGTTWSAWDGVWVPITTGFSASVTPMGGNQQPMAMRQGNLVAVRGRVSVAANSPGSHTFGDIPSGMVPPIVMELGHGAINGTQQSRYFANNTGVLGVQNWPNSGAATTGGLSGVYGIGSA
jgi:hypothetical protein